MSRDLAWDIMEASEDGGELAVIISNLASSLVSMVQKGRSEYELSGRDIVSFCRSSGPLKTSGLLNVYPVQEYAQCFRAAKVKSREELDGLCNENLANQCLQSSVSALVSAEKDYRNFITELDEDCRMHEDKIKHPVLKVGDLCKEDIKFVQAHSGTETSLRDILANSSKTLFVLRKHYV